jgi:hypothetical protein
VSLVLADRPDQVDRFPYPMSASAITGSPGDLTMRPAFSAVADIVNGAVMRPPGLDGIRHQVTMHNQCSHRVAFQVLYTRSKTLIDLIGDGAYYNRVRELS